jgi:hypothetical protein
MKLIKHVINTWLGAIHIFPVLVLFYDVVSSGSTVLALLLPMALFGALFSLSSLVMCLLLITPVSKVLLTANAKLCLWMFVVSLSIILNVALIWYFLFNCFITWQELPFVACAITAALIAVLLRLQFFFQITTLQTKTYEKDLV